MKQRGQKGFSMIEVLVTFSIFSLATMALGLVEMSNAQRARELRARDIAFARAQAFMERMLRMPFGSPNPPALTPADYDRIFGSDADVRDLSLTQLQRRDTNNDGTVDDPPIRFRLRGTEDAGQWAIFVDADLDGDGILAGSPIIVGGDIDGDGTVDVRDGAGGEGRLDLMRIEIRHNGRILLRTLRARTAQEGDEALGLE